MLVLNKTDIASASIETRPVGAHLAPYATKFVHRRERVDGRPVRLLPDPRPSVQIMLGDQYWIRPRASSSQWCRLPRVALWAPRWHWAYGFARGRIEAFALVLTPRGYHAIPKKVPVGETGFVFHMPISDGELSVGPDRDETFDRWCDRLEVTLPTWFRDTRSTLQISQEALAELHMGAGGSVAAAARVQGLSTRQFRRRFAAAYGVTPKTYQRTVRVDRMIRQLHPRPWEQDPFDSQPIAFADQAHAIREFRRATGMTPMQYQTRKLSADSTLRSVSDLSVAPPQPR